MRDPIDLKRMRYILEVARAEAITTAAETLGVTQSALSRSIAEVEDALGTPLFLRLPRGIQLTPAGQRFVDGAKRLLGDIDSLVAQVREPDDLLGGRLRLGIAPSGYISHASDALVAFTRDYPRVDIEIVTGSTQSLCPRLLNGEFDLLLGSSSYLKRWRDLELVPLATMHFACMMRPGHPLLASRQPVREVDVLKYPWVLPESVEPIYSDIGQRFARHGLPPFQPRYLVENFAVVRQLVAQTDAIYPLVHPDPGFGPLARQFAMLKDVVKLPPHVMSLAYPASRPRSQVALRLQAILMQTLAQHGTPAQPAAGAPADQPAADAGADHPFTLPGCLPSGRPHEFNEPVNL